MPIRYRAVGAEGAPRVRTFSFNCQKKQVCIFIALSHKQLLDWTYLPLKNFIRKKVHCFLPAQSSISTIPFAPSHCQVEHTPKGHLNDRNNRYLCFFLWKIDRLKYIFQVLVQCPPAAAQIQVRIGSIA